MPEENQGQPIEPQSEKQERTETWAHTTDPSRHDPQQFRYLVHAINPYAKFSMGMIGAQLALENPDNINSDDGDQTIDLSQAPQRLTERVALSTSLIDQDHRATWSTAGLLIVAPSENVIIASSTDAGTTVMSKKLLLERTAREHVPSPEDILRGTDPYTYNEVTVLAKHNGSIIALGGFFYKTTDDGTPLDTALYERVKMHAEILQLPLIPIVEPHQYLNSRIVRFDNFFFVDHQGKRVTLQGKQGRRFRAEDGQTHRSSFASPEEMQKIFEYLLENGITQEEIAELKKQFEEDDVFRQQPKIFYDTDGNISRVEKSRGYGKEEVKISITHDKYEMVNVDEKSQDELGSLLGGGYRSAFNLDMTQRSKEMEQMKSLHPQAQQVIDEAVQYASVEEKIKLQKWWESVQDAVKREQESLERMQQMQISLKNIFNIHIKEEQ